MSRTDIPAKVGPEFLAPSDIPPKGADIPAPPDIPPKGADIPAWEPKIDHFEIFKNRSYF
jgi:hypothetical protein